MAEEHAMRCQARPAAVRPAYREDPLCASMANSVVRFRGIDVPVCRIHAANYAAWGGKADASAEARWAWGHWPSDRTTAFARFAEARERAGSEERRSLERVPDVGTCRVCGRRFALFRLASSGTLVVFHHNIARRTRCEGAGTPPVEGSVTHRYSERPVARVGDS